MAAHSGSRYLMMRRLDQLEGILEPGCGGRQAIALAECISTSQLIQSDAASALQVKAAGAFSHSEQTNTRWCCKN